jgi:hypothetical protein
VNIGVSTADIAARVRAHKLACTELRAAMFLRDFERAGLAANGPDGWRITERGYAVARGLLTHDKEEREAA